MDVIIRANRWQHIRLLLALNATSDYCKQIIFEPNYKICYDNDTGDIHISGIINQHSADFKKHLKRYIIAHSNIIAAPFDFIIQLAPENFFLATRLSSFFYACTTRAYTLIKKKAQNIAVKFDACTTRADNMCSIDYNVGIYMFFV